MVPYFMDLCESGRGCYSNEYKDFAFSNLSTILSMTDVSQNDFEAWWSQQVSTQFDLPLDDVSSIYTSSDPYETDGSLRAMWKYGTAKGVNGTPTAYINGTKLDSVPMTVNGWMKVLNDVYNSRYSATAAAKYLQN